MAYPDHGTLPIRHRIRYRYAPLCVYVYDRIRPYLYRLRVFSRHRHTSSGNDGNTAGTEASGTNRAAFLLDILVAHANRRMGDWMVIEDFKRPTLGA